MRILVLGGSGMLGSEVCRAAREAGHEFYRPANHAIDITNPEQVLTQIAATAAPVVINCAGIISGAWGMDDRSVKINAYGPHLLARHCETHSKHLIHISTDCVFSGTRGGRRSPADPTDPIDIYGRSKLAGEPEGDHVTVVRTSFIGPRHGLWAWLVGEATPSDSPTAGQVHGWTHAMWSGSTVDAVARALVALAENPPGGVQHLATAELVSKYDVLLYLKNALGLNVEIEPRHYPAINRALWPSLEPLPHIEAAIARLAMRAEGVALWGARDD